jgi:hypothetical protein
LPIGPRTTALVGHDISRAGQALGVQLYDWPRGQGPVGIDKSSDRKVHRQVCAYATRIARSLACIKHSLCHSLTCSRSPRAVPAPHHHLTRVSLRGTRDNTRSRSGICHCVRPAKALATPGRSVQLCIERMAKVASRSSSCSMPALRARSLTQLWHLSTPACGQRSLKIVCAMQQGNKTSSIDLMTQIQPCALLAANIECHTRTVGRCTGTQPTQDCKIELRASRRAWCTVVSKTDSIVIGR